MNGKGYNLISALVFTGVALAHAVRAARGLPLVIGSWPAPVGLSWLAAAAAGLLAFWGLRLALTRGA